MATSSNARSRMRSWGPSDGMRLKLTIAYDGRPYHGWQSQACGHTVQDFIQRALAGGGQAAAPTAGGRPHRYRRARAGPDRAFRSATRAGHEAVQLGAGAQLQTSCHHPHPGLRGSGRGFPQPVFVRPAKSIGTICAPIRSCRRWKAGLAWHLPRSLDPGVLARALALFCGRHDFHAFAAYRGNELPDMDWWRTLHRADLETLADGYRITFVGDGFLYKMVRLLTGAAVHAAQGRLSPGRTRRLARPTARPAPRQIPELRARRWALPATGALLIHHHIQI